MVNWLPMQEKKRKNNMIAMMSWQVIVFLLLEVVFAFANNSAVDNPQFVVTQATDQIFLAVRERDAYQAGNNEHFIAEVSKILENTVDFEAFSRGVMGSYASSQRYKQLSSETERKLFRQRVDQFNKAFKAQLIQIYVDSLVRFHGKSIETHLVLEGQNREGGSQTVVQQLVDKEGKVYTIQYTMRRNKIGQWRLNNIVIEGVNLGLVYRNQFAASMDKYHGDIDKVIQTWKVEMEAVK